MPTMTAERPKPETRSMQSYLEEQLYGKAPVTTGARRPRRPKVKPPKSKSRNVNGYVKRVLRYKALYARLEAKRDALAPLVAKVNVAESQAVVARGKLNGRQMAEAERILRELAP